MAIVQELTEFDVSEAEVLCSRAFEQMQYRDTRHYTYSVQHICQVLSAGIKSPKHIVLKAVDHGCIVGVMALELSDFSFYAVNERSAHEIVWHGDPILGPKNQLKIQKLLLDYAEQILKGLGVKKFVVLTDSRYESFSKFLVRNGYNHTTSAHIKEI